MKTILISWCEGLLEAFRDGILIFFELLRLEEAEENLILVLRDFWGRYMVQLIANLVDQKNLLQENSEKLSIAYFEVRKI